MKFNYVANNKPTAEYLDAVFQALQEMEYIEKGQIEWHREGDVAVTSLRKGAESAGHHLVFGYLQWHKVLPEFRLDDIAKTKQASLSQPERIAIFTAADEGRVCNILQEVRIPLALIDLSNLLRRPKIQPEIVADASLDKIAHSDLG